MTVKSLKFCLFLILVFCCASVGGANTTRYVSDDLTIPMRSGTTLNHKILKFLHSGIAVEVKEVTEDGKHSWIMLVNDKNRLGWVETTSLMDEPHANIQVIELNKKIVTLLDKNYQIKSEFDKLKQQNIKLKKTVTKLENNNAETLSTLTHLRESAARPIEIAKLNRVLEQKIDAQKNENEELIRENIFLSNKNIKEWFIIGGGVSIGSLMLGLLITRVSWRRKQSWGGDDF